MVAVHRIVIFQLKRGKNALSNGTTLSIRSRFFFFCKEIVNRLLVVVICIRISIQYV
jgi:hypothetical protein